ncbi:MAG: lipase [Acidimicrobiia bacterium]|nr:lipase [Acidimicrobiia bacterium]
MPTRRMVVVLALVTLVLLGAPQVARGAGDPPLSIDPAAALAALHCPATFAHPKTPVLLVHGTGSTVEESWTHTFAKTLPLDGHDVCTIDLPQRALVDAQISAEYVVVAMHTMAGRAGRKIDVVGHSQGGLEPRWALKWFPSTRSLVDDYVSISSTQHGSADADGICTVGSCAPSVWQQRTTSQFLKALNAGDETPGDLSYTSIYSLTDEVVPELPPPSTSRLDGARNIALQDVCPGRPADHFSILWDAVAEALVMDALDHPGPADPARLGAAVCLGVIAPGLDAADVAYMHTVALANAFQTTVVTGPMSSTEPPLKPYVLATQAAAAPSPAPAAGGPPAPSTPAPSPRANAPMVQGKSLAATGGRAPLGGAAALLGLALALKRMKRS